MRALIALLGFLTLGLVGIVMWQLASTLVAGLPQEIGEAEQRTLRIATWMSAVSFGSVVLSVVLTAAYLWTISRKSRAEVGK